MVRQFIKACALLLFLMVGWGGIYAQPTTVGQTFASLLFLDGKNLIEYKEVELGLDELISFEAFDLQPSSTLNLKVTGAGFKTVQQDYTTNERGEVKTTLFFPKARAKLTCTLRFVTKNGVDEQIKFYLKPV